MKHVTFLFLFLVFGCGMHAQKAEKKVLLIRAGSIIDGSLQFEVYNNLGKKVFAKPVTWVSVNLWDWVFIKDKPHDLFTVFFTNGRPAGIDSIENMRTAHLNDSLIALKRNGKWGYFDRKAKKKIDYQFEEVSDFSDGFAKVQKDGEIFFIDTSGKRTQDPPDAKQESYSPKYNFQLLVFAEGLANFQNRQYSVFTENNKKGLRDKKGNVTIDAIYDGLYNLNDKFELLIVKQNGLFGVATVRGKIILPIRYKEIYLMNSY